MLSTSGRVSEVHRKRWTASLCRAGVQHLRAQEGVTCLQVTAYQVIQNSGATGKMPTQVQFKISDPGDQAVSAHTDPRLLLWGPGAPANSIP